MVVIKVGEFTSFFHDPLNNLRTTQHPVGPGLQHGPLELGWKGSSCNRYDLEDKFISHASLVEISQSHASLSGREKIISSGRWRVVLVSHHLNQPSSRRLPKSLDL